MTDDLTPDAISELASGYVDDELTADERGLVERDAALIAEVDRVRQVRAVLGDVEPPPISLREEHLAAALDAWDRLPEAERTGAGRDGTPRRLARDATAADAAVAAGAASITAAPARRGERRRSWSTAWMGAAAAAMLVVAGAAVVIQGTGGDDDSADDSAEGAAVLEPADGDTATSPADGAEESAVSDEEARDATAALGELADGDPADAAEIIAENVPEDGIDTGIDTPAPPIDVPLEEIDGTEQLAIFASDAIGAPVASDAGTSGDVGDPAEAESLFDLRRCGTVDVLVGPASYGGRPVVVGIDTGRDLAFAHDLVDCTEIARVRLP